MTVEYPDVEGAVRTFLRSHADVQSAVAQRVFFAVPDNPTFPLVTVALVGGFDDPAGAPLDQALVRLDAWGDLHPGSQHHPNKAQAGAAAVAVRQALHDLRGGVEVTVNGTPTRLGGGVVQSVVYLPDPANHRPRYTITAQFTAARKVAV